MAKLGKRAKAIREKVDAEKQYAVATFQTVEDAKHLLSLRLNWPGGAPMVIRLEPIPVYLVALFIVVVLPIRLYTCIFQLPFAVPTCVTNHRPRSLHERIFFGVVGD